MPCLVTEQSVCDIREGHVGDLALRKSATKIAREIGDEPPKNKLQLGFRVWGFRELGAKYLYKLFGPSVGNSDGLPTDLHQCSLHSPQQAFQQVVVARDTSSPQPQTLNTKHCR